MPIAEIPKTFSAKSIALPALVFTVVGLISGCSGSSESVASDSQPANDSDGSSEPTTTQVEFRITVPAYQSDALQVQLEWGDTRLSGVWNTDELWTVSSELPVNTENRLIISFNDRNGDITLGRYVTDFKTGTGEAEIFVVSADQFNTAQWDDDNDGVSNLDELIAGSNPDGDDLLQQTQANIELVPDKTFRITWQATPDAQHYRVLENPDGNILAVGGHNEDSFSPGFNADQISNRAFSSGAVFLY